MHIILCDILNDVPTSKCNNYESFKKWLYKQFSCQFIQLSRQSTRLYIKRCTGEEDKCMSLKYSKKMCLHVHSFWEINEYIQLLFISKVTIFDQFMLDECLICTTNIIDIIDTHSNPTLPLSIYCGLLLKT